MRIYFDHNATTPVDPGRRRRHDRGARRGFRQRLERASFRAKGQSQLERPARKSAALIRAEPSEIVFTSGGTEADNFALRGVAEALEPTGRRHLIASAIEHEAVLVTLKALARRGWKTTLLPVDATGIVGRRRSRRA